MVLIIYIAWNLEAELLVYRYVAFLSVLKTVMVPSTPTDQAGLLNLH